MNILKAIFLLVIWIVGILILFYLLENPTAFAQEEYTNEQIVNAIYKAENSITYPYGIKSLKYENRTDRSLSQHDWARWICTNTVRNHRKRHAKHDCGKTFIECLGDRYCPPKAHKLNSNWVKNVMFFLNK